MTAAKRHLTASGPEPSRGQRFDLLVDQVVDYAIFLLDADGLVATWNPGAERIKGYKASEIIGKHFSSFYPDEDIWSRKPYRELEIAAREGRFEDEGWRLRKDGSRFWANVIITAIRNEAGQLLGFAKITRDITEHHRQEQQLTQAAAELRSANDTLSRQAEELARARDVAAIKEDRFDTALRKVEGCTRPIHPTADDNRLRCLCHRMLPSVASGLRTKD